MKHRQRLLVAVALLIASSVEAAMVAQELSYEIDKAEFESVLVYDDSVQAARPGLVMFPNWYGINAGQIEKAKAIAGKRYVVLVADVYGAALQPADDKAAAPVPPLPLECDLPPDADR